jgi:hypothetical protein
MFKNVKKSILVIFLINLIVITICNAKIEESKCLQIIKEHKRNTDLIKKDITSNMFLIKDDNTCLELLISKGYNKEAEFLMLELSKRGITFKDQVQNATENMTKNVKKILNDYKFDESDYLTVSPAFQWAQNTEYIFLQIKYSHRFDAPGCLEAKIDGININTGSNNASFQAYCIQGDVPIIFKLELSFSGNVMSEGSSYESTSAGRYEIRIKKETTGFWKKLLHVDFEAPRNMRMWLEMRKKYENELEKFDKQNEEDDYKKFEQDIYKNKKGYKDGERVFRDKELNYDDDDENDVENEEDDNLKDDNFADLGDL